MDVKYFKAAIKDADKLRDSLAVIASRGSMNHSVIQVTKVLDVLMRDLEKEAQLEDPQ
jgi:hypothetical protein